MKYIFLFIGLFVTFSAHAQSDSLKTYTGKYIFPEGSPVTEAIVELKQDKLTISSTMGSASLTRQQGDIFSVDEYGGQVEFLRDTAKSISGIKVNIPAANIDMQGVKDSTTGAANEAVNWKRENKYWNFQELDVSLVYRN